MKKKILALAAAGLLPFAASATSPVPPPPEPPQVSPPVQPPVPPASATTPAPTRFEARTTYGDIARVLAAQPVYERAAQPRRECRMEGSGYSAAGSDAPRCDDPSAGGERIVAYDVTYQYMGRDFRIRLPYDPGEQMAVNVDVRPPAPPRSGYRIPQTRGPY